MPEDKTPTPEAAPAEAPPEPVAEIEPPSTSISKERGHGQDSRATARTGDDPDAPSTRITEGRGIVERLAEHEADIQHKNAPKGWPKQPK